MSITRSRDSGSSWRKASYSAGNGECVEVSSRPGLVSIRDSKDPEGPVLSYSTDAFQSFLDAAKRGRCSSWASQSWSAACPAPSATTRQLRDRRPRLPAPARLETAGAGRFNYSGEAAAAWADHPQTRHRTKTVSPESFIRNSTETWLYSSVLRAAIYRTSRFNGTYATFTAFTLRSRAAGAVTSGTACSRCYRCLAPSDDGRYDPIKALLNQIWEY